MSYTFLLILLLVYLLYKIYLLFSIPSSLAHLPTVSAIEFVRSVFQKESNGDRLSRMFPPNLGGDGLGMMWLAGDMTLYVTSYTLYREVFNDSIHFHKGVPGKMYFNSLMKVFFGTSNVVQSDAEVWKRHRRTINPSFKKGWDTQLFGESAKDLISILEPRSGEAIVVNEYLQKLTLDVLGKGLLDIDFEALKSKEASRLLYCYNRTMEGLFDPLYMFFPFLENFSPSRQLIIKECSEMRRYFKQIIQQRYQEIENGEQKDDILSLMIKSSLEGEVMSDSDMVNNLSIIFFAGHDTTAHSLTSNLYFIAKYPEIQAKLRTEIIQVMGDKPGVIPTLEQQNKFTYMTQFIKESMRLFLNVGKVQRICVQDTKLSNGLVIPKGTKMALLPWSAHRDPKAFPEPETFNPDRFQDPFGEQSLKWSPFGTGARMCIGVNFSLVEQRVVLAMLLLKFNVEFGPQYKQLENPKMNLFGLNRPIDLDLVFKLRG